MDIVTQSMNRSTAKLQQDASIAVMKMAMETQENMAETVVNELLEAPVVPSAGLPPAIVDVYI